MIVSQVLDELGITLDHELADITPGLEKPRIQTGASVRHVHCTHLIDMFINLSPLFLASFLLWMFST